MKIFFKTGVMMMKDICFAFTFVSGFGKCLLSKEIKYTDIADGIEKMLEMYEKIDLKTIDEIIEFDREVQEETRKMIKQN